MANIANVTTAPFFYGKDSNPKQDLSAQEFRRRIDAYLDRVAAGQAAPAGRDRITAITANLRGQACEWWTEYLPARLTVEQYEFCCVNVADYWVKFSREFHKIRSATDASINWINWKQGDEDAYGFANRVCAAAYNFEKLTVDQDRQRNAPTQAWPSCQDSDRVAAFRDAYEDLNAVETAAADGDAHARSNLERRLHSTRMTTILVAKVIHNGVKDNRLWPKIIECETNFTSRDDMCEIIREAESRLPKPHSGHNGGNGRKNGNGNGLSAITETPEEDGAKVDAAKATRKSKTKDEPRKTSDAKKKCGFCGGTTHAEPKCWARKSAIKALKEKKAAETSSTSSEAGHADVAGVSSMSSGFANVGYV